MLDWINSAERKPDPHRPVHVIRPGDVSCGEICTYHDGRWNGLADSHPEDFTRQDFIRWAYVPPWNPGALS